IDQRTKRVVHTFSVLGTPTDLLVGHHSLFVGTQEGFIHQVEPATDIRIGDWRVPNASKASPFVDDRGAGFLAYRAPNTVWAAGFRSISRIDLSLGGRGYYRPHRSTVWGPFAYGFGSLWTTASEPGLFRLAPRTLRHQATVAR